MMRQAKATILLILFICSQLLILLQVAALQYHRFNEKHSSLEISSHILQFHFSHEAWAQINPNAHHEMLLHGQMFDIKNIQQTKTEVIISGHFDRHEDHLLNKLQPHSQKKNTLLISPFAWCVLFFEPPLEFNFYKVPSTTIFYPTLHIVLPITELKQRDQPPKQDQFFDIA